MRLYSARTAPDREQSAESAQQPSAQATAPNEEGAEAEPAGDPRAGAEQGRREDREVEGLGGLPLQVEQPGTAEAVVEETTEG